MAQFETGNHSAGNECMTYPPIKVRFGFGGAIYWSISLLKAEAFSRSKSRSPVAA
jgi:hypothetical protein